MPTFRYEVIDASGNTVRGSMVADSREAVLERMRELQYRVVDISVGRERSFLADLNNRFQSIKLRELVVFTRQFSTMIDAGLTVVKCLDILSSQTKNPFFKESINALKVDISSGLSLADAMAKHPRIFNDLYVNMIRAAELGGILDIILSRIAGYLENEQEIKTKIKSAMMYPCVVLAFAVLMAGAIVFFVLPKFKTIFAGLVGPDYQLPVLTRYLLDSGAIARQYWYVPILLIIGIVTTWKLIARTESGRYKLDMLKLKIPVMGELLLKISVARVARTLGTLLSSGIPVLRALEIVKTTAGNAVVAEALDQARQAVHQGQRMSEPLAESGIFPLMTTQMIQVGEETGRVDEMLNKVAGFYEEEVDALIRGLTALIEPLMIIGLGGFVGFVAVAVLKPIYGVLEAMSAE